MQEKLTFAKLNWQNIKAFLLCASFDFSCLTKRFTFNTAIYVCVGDARLILDVNQSLSQSFFVIPPPLV